MDPIESHLSPIIRLFPRFSPIPSFFPSRRLIVSLLFQLTVMIVPFRYRNSNLRGRWDDDRYRWWWRIKGEKKEREREKKDIDRNNIPAATLEYYNLCRAEFKSRGEYLSLDEANRIGLYRAKFPERRHGLETIPSLSKGRFECFRKLDGGRRGPAGFEWLRQTDSRVLRRHYLHDKFPSRTRNEFFPFIFFLSIHSLARFSFFHSDYVSPLSYSSWFPFGCDFSFFFSKRRNRNFHSEYPTGGK